eukprot:scpid19460/ scgid28417/ 
MCSLREVLGQNVLPCCVQVVEKPPACLQNGFSPKTSAEASSIGSPSPEGQDKVASPSSEKQLTLRLLSGQRAESLLMEREETGMLYRHSIAEANPSAPLGAQIAIDAKMILPGDLCNVQVSVDDLIFRVREFERESLPYCQGDIDKLRIRVERAAQGFSQGRVLTVGDLNTEHPSFHTTGIDGSEQSIEISGSLWDQVPVCVMEVVVDVQWLASYLRESTKSTSTGNGSNGGEAHHSHDEVNAEFDIPCRLWQDGGTDQDKQPMNMVIIQYTRDTEVLGTDGAQLYTLPVSQFHAWLRVLESDDIMDDVTMDEQLQDMHEKGMVILGRGNIFPLLSIFTEVKFAAPAATAAAAPMPRATHLVRSVDDSVINGTTNSNAAHSLQSGPTSLPPDMLNGMGLKRQHVAGGVANASDPENPRWMSVDGASDPAVGFDPAAKIPVQSRKSAPQLPTIQVPDWNATVSSPRQMRPQRPHSEYHSTDAASPHLDEHTTLRPLPEPPKRSTHNRTTRRFKAANARDSHPKRQVLTRSSASTPNLLPPQLDQESSSTSSARSPPRIPVGPIPSLHQSKHFEVRFEAPSPGDCLEYPQAAAATTQGKQSPSSPPAARPHNMHSPLRRTNAQPSISPTQEEEDTQSDSNGDSSQRRRVKSEGTINNIHKPTIAVNKRSESASARHELQVVSPPGLAAEPKAHGGVRGCRDNLPSPRSPLRRAAGNAKTAFLALSRTISQPVPAVIHQCPDTQEQRQSHPQLRHVGKPWEQTVEDIGEPDDGDVVQYLTEFDDGEGSAPEDLLHPLLAVHDDRGVMFWKERCNSLQDELRICQEILREKTQACTQLQAQLGLLKKNMNRLSASYSAPNEIDGSKFGVDVCDLSVQQVCKLLQAYNLGQYEFIFKTHKIDGSSFASLNHITLEKQLGVKERAHRDIILKLAGSGLVEQV